MSQIVFNVYWYLFSSHQITIILIVHTNNGRRTVNTNLIKSLTGSSRTFSKFIIQATRGGTVNTAAKLQNTVSSTDNATAPPAWAVCCFKENKNKIRSIQSSLEFRLISLGLSSGCDSHVMFLLKPFHSHSTSFHKRW